MKVPTIFKLGIEAYCGAWLWIMLFYVIIKGVVELIH